MQTETIRNGCEVKITIEASFLSKPGFSVGWGFFCFSFFHEVNIDLNRKFKSRIINISIIM